MNKKVEAVAWNLFFPGLAQITVTKRLGKGVFFFLLALLININARINDIVILSFKGETQRAVEATDYQWLLFYSCLYFFALWDGYRECGGIKESYAFIPFVFSGYMVTIGIVFSPSIHLSGFLLGPLWLPVIVAVISFLGGMLLRTIILNVVEKRPG
ncbi:hypothetical protein M3689_02660 [Alkalihalophilus marmarensis]|jgi:hypothetical protein|uniref:hypothetical protein n=1 Tax=Alkalihalophilus marmarensis TaxID=521377 RepID=UPI0020418005|nr:hypothetical protein [Alkalihalophilus marmarensis]MCM3488205.1 hypothetical protein [Alkalihalophilus marmarensis]